MGMEGWTDLVPATGAPETGVILGPDTAGAGATGGGATEFPAGDGASTLGRGAVARGRGKAAASCPAILSANDGRAPGVAGTCPDAGAGTGRLPGRGLEDERPGMSDAI